MSDIQWFWEQNGEQQGPTSDTELRQKFEDGELDSGTLVWHEGLTDWQPAHSLGLARAKSGPPAIPENAPEGHLVPVHQKASLPEDQPVREAKLREGFHPRIRHSFGRGWELLKSDFWPFVGMFALVSIMTGVAAQLYVTVFFLIYPLMAGLNWYILNRKRGNPVTIDALFFGFKRRFGDLAILNLVLTLPLIIFFGIAFGLFMALMIAIAPSDPPSEEAAIFMVLGIAVGLSLLFIIPLMIMFAIANFSMTLIIDCDINWKESLKLAWRATKPHFVKLMLFAFLYSLVTQLGLIALYFGIFITGTWASIAFIYLYEDAFGDEPDSASNPN